MGCGGLHRQAGGTGPAATRASHPLPRRIRPERESARASEHLRRFASEALRPRGVWCAHIASLKREPGKALPILSSLRADPSNYVQDSVANWLNDAAKDQPDWVRGLCAEWLKATPADATRRICHRTLRNLK